MAEKFSGKGRGAGRPVDPGKDEAIIQAAYELLFQGGPAAVSIEAVARAAGVSKVTIYSRYANKDALVEAVISHQAEQLVISLAITPGHPDNLRDALRIFGAKLLPLVLGGDHLGCLRAIVTTHTPESLLDRIYRSGPAATIERLETWMGEVHQAGLAHIPQPACSAELFLGMLLGLDLVRFIYGQTPVHPGERLHEHVEVVVDAFIRLHPPRPDTS